MGGQQCKEGMVYVSNKTLPDAHASSSNFGIVNCFNIPLETLLQKTRQTPELVNISFNLTSGVVRDAEPAKAGMATL